MTISPHFEAQLRKTSAFPSGTWEEGKGIEHEHEHEHEVACTGLQFPFLSGFRNPVSEIVSGPERHCYLNGNTPPVSQTHFEITSK